MGRERVKKTREWIGVWEECQKNSNCGDRRNMMWKKVGPCGWVWRWFGNKRRQEKFFDSFYLYLAWRCLLEFYSNKRRVVPAFLFLLLCIVCCCWLCLWILCLSLCLTPYLPFPSYFSLSCLFAPCFGGVLSHGFGFHTIMILCSDAIWCIFIESYNFYWIVCILKSHPFS